MKVRFDKYDASDELIATRSVDGVTQVLDGTTIGASAGIIISVLNGEGTLQVITVPLNGRVELYAV